MDTFTTRRVSLESQIGWTPIVGLVFARPEQSWVKEQVLQSLLYFHVRSGSAVDFFFVGYERREGLDGIDGDLGFWLTSGMQPKVHRKFRRVCQEPEWFFSPEEFDTVRRELSRDTQWKYSGGVEILFLEPVKAFPDIDLRNCLSLNLSKIVDQGEGASVQELFEHIFDYADKIDNDDPIAGLSNYLGASSVKKSGKKFLVSLFPKGLGQDIADLSQFAVRDFGTSRKVRLLEAEYRQKILREGKKAKKKMQKDLRKARKK